LKDKRDAGFAPQKGCKAMNKRSVTLKFQLLILMLGCLLLPGCMPATGQDSPIVIGTLYNLSGDQAGLDLPSYRGAMLAAEQLNRNGGVLGKKLLLNLLDGTSDPAVLKQKTLQQMQLNPDTAAFLGLSDTDMVLPAAQAAAASHRVFLTSGATSPKLPAQVPEYLFLACFGDNVQAAAAAEFAYRHKKARSVAVVYNAGETYTSLLQAYFVTRFQQLGGQIVSVQGYGRADLPAAIEQLPQADAVFFAAMPQDVLRGVRLLRKAGFTVPIIGGDGYDSETIWQGQTAISEVFYTTHAYLEAGNPDPQVQAFRSAYLGAYGYEPDAFAALGYDAVNLLAQAINAAQSVEPAAILKAMAAIKDFAGITGNISYGNGSRIPQKSVTILEVQGGTPGLVMQLLPEQIPAP
jgi:branched-chain amino acid transport system substrate-binding protein